LTAVASADAATGGTLNDTISVGAGNVTIIGGSGADSIKVASGNAIVLGDNGIVSYSNAGVLTQIQSTDPTYGGGDTITLGAGNDYAIGGVGDDKLNVGAGTSIVFGDDAIITFNNGALASYLAQDPNTVGANTIVVGTGKSIIYAGSATLTASSMPHNTVTAPSTATIIQPASTTIWQVAASPPLSATSAADLTESQLQQIVVEAKAIWEHTPGITAAEIASLDRITVELGNLPEGALGVTIGSLILIDSNAAGWGWLVDGGSSEFQATGMPGVFAAKAGTAAASHIDLLSTVLHEMGNAMGFAEDTGQDVTGQILAAGTRRLPTIGWDSSTALRVSGNAPVLNQDLSWLMDFLDTGSQDVTSLQRGLAGRFKLPSLRG
jgi:hypothetical protein